MPKRKSPKNESASKLAKPEPEIDKTISRAKNVLSVNASKSLQPNWFARRPLISSLLSVALLWMSMPPLANIQLDQFIPFAPHFPFISLLAWIALIPLIGLVVSPEIGSKPLRKIWFASLIYWAATLYFIPFPHPALWIGWVAISLYLSIYIPLFVIASRALVHRMQVPPAVIVPVTWIGFEYFRGTFLTGFGLTQLGHSQYSLPLVIQIADLFGAYGLSFAMVLVATCLGIALLKSGMKSRILHLGVVCMTIAIVVAYGKFRLAEGRLIADSNNTRLSVAILQGNVDTVFPGTPEEAEELVRFKIEHYRELASSERLWTIDERNSSKPRIDLLVWPEGKFPAPDVFVEANQTVKSELDDRLQASRTDFEFAFRWMQSAARSVDDAADLKMNPHAIPSIVGAQSLNPLSGDIYNSALLVDSNGGVQARYRKNHRVMIGEYIPFENWIPALRGLTPSGKGLTAGVSGTAFQFAGFTLCPNICFESCVPHLIRRHVNQLSDLGDEPDFIINISDDGWFYGTSCLDFHLACTVFRAVELRKPTIVAANTGISAYIDGCGQFQATGPRRSSEILIVHAKPDGRNTLYRIVGDWPAILCMLMALFGLVVAWKLRRK